MSVFHRMLNGSSGCEDLLGCVFQLNDLETAAYFSLLEHPDARMEQIAAALDRDRSTAQRAVQKLVHLNLAEREAEPLDGGGYCYTYRAIEPRAVRERIEARLEAFEDAARERLDRFHEEAVARLDGEAPLEVEAEDRAAASP